MVNRVPNDIHDVIGVGLDKRAVGSAAAFGNSHLCRFE
jgi:hypothetical protein